MSHLPGGFLRVLFLILSKSKAHFFKSSNLTYFKAPSFVECKYTFGAHPASNAYFHLVALIAHESPGFKPFGFISLNANYISNPPFLVKAKYSSVITPHIV